jgi:CRISPR-associated protein Csy1
MTSIGRQCAPEYFAPLPKRTLAPRERIRVGFLSGFLYECTVGKYFRSWITDLDRTRFEVFTYYTGFKKDAFNLSLAQSVEHYRHLFEPAPNVARAVLADRLDVLVYPEVGMETTGNLLACMRLAPVQCAGWGHPVTTGRPNIDFYLTCGDMEPEGADSHYSETIVRLPGLGTRYPRPQVEAERSRADFGLPEGRHLYLCPQSAFKIHPDTDAILAAILAADPAATLVFFRDFDAPLTDAFRARLYKALESKGIANRVPAARRPRGLPPDEPTLRGIPRHAALVGRQYHPGCPCRGATRGDASRRLHARASECGDAAHA